MTKYIKKAISTILIYVMLLTSIPQTQAEIKATERIKVMTITATGVGDDVTAYVYATGDGTTGYTFTMDENELHFVSKDEADILNISISVDAPDIIDENSLFYENKYSVGNYISIGDEISFIYNTGNSKKDEYIKVYYKFTLERPAENDFLDDVETDIKVQKLLVETTSKGFNPGDGNYALIRFNAMTKVKGFLYYGDVKMRIRVLNSSGKYVYQKKSTISGYGVYAELKWNGKASKKNNAGVKAGEYVKSGKYKVEVYLEYKGDDVKVTSKKTKKLVVSRKASSGSKGISSINSVPTYTGDAELDYIAEQMIKDAGVKNSMSNDKKVKLIYHWITTNFKHMNYNSSEEYKIYYNTKKLKSKIQAYKKKCDKKCKKGKIIYNYTNVDEQWNMERRIGVCDDHAAIFKILCNHVGIDVGVCGGYYLNRNGTKAGHAWNYAIIDGKTYYYDVDVELQNLGKTSSAYTWYKKTKTESEKNHEFEYNNSEQKYHYVIQEDPEVEVIVHNWVPEE